MGHRQSKIRIKLIPGLGPGYLLSYIMSVYQVKKYLPIIHVHGGGSRGITSPMSGQFGNYTDCWVVLKNYYQQHMLDLSSSIHHFFVALQLTLSKIVEFFNYKFPSLLQSMLVFNCHTE